MSQTDPQDTNGHPKAVKPFAAQDYANDGKKHLLLAASGSVATIKIPNILQELSVHRDLSVRVVLSKSAQNFLMGQSAEQPHYRSLTLIPNVDGIYLDDDEWTPPWIRNAAILHIELRRWLDLMVVAPLSADTMAKMSMGLSDNLLLSILRAWDTTGEIEGSRRKVVVVAPAMNTGMWLHPVTKRHLEVLEGEWGVGQSDAGWVDVLRPTEKVLACGDSGIGAMKDWHEIVACIERYLGLGKT